LDDAVLPQHLSWPQLLQRRLRLAQGGRHHRGLLRGPYAIGRRRWQVKLHFVTPPLRTAVARFFHWHASSPHAFHSLGRANFPAHPILHQYTAIRGAPSVFFSSVRSRSLGKANRLVR